MMVLHERSFTDVLRAADDEARRCGARMLGSEHVLLGLLRSRDPVTQRVTGEQPRLSYDAVRAAVAGGRADAQGRSTTRRTPELRMALSDCGAKWRFLVRTRQLEMTRPARLDTAQLWLAVAESSATHRLLRSLGVDPKEIRTIVLTAMARHDAPVPAWPTTVSRGAVRRVVDRLARHRS